MQRHEARPQATVMPLVFATFASNPSWSVAANWNRILGTSVVNDLLVGINDNTVDSYPLDMLGLGDVNAQLGIGGGQPMPGLSEIRMGNNVSNIGNLAVASNTANRVYQINERLTWVRGRHALKFGGSWNYYQMERYYSGNNGQLGFIAYNSFNFTGAAFADFLLDQVSLKGRGSLAEPWTHLQNRVGFFVADDYKVRDNLTINAGLRWGYMSPLVEQDDRQANFDLANAQLQLAGQNGNSRGLYKAYYGGWEPRFGAAYRHGDRWVFRGGYGITQFMEGTGANQRLPLNPPYFFESQVPFDRTSGAGTIASGFDGLRPLDTPSGQVRVWDPNLKPQFTQQWNVFTEYLLGAKSSINVGYVGNTSKNLIMTIDANQPLPGTGAREHLAAAAQRRPWFPFNRDITLAVMTTSRGRSNYHALQTTFKQRPVAGTGVRGELHVRQGDVEQPRLLRRDRRGRGGRELVADEQLRHRGELRPRVLRRAARRLARGELRAAVRTGARVRLVVEPRARRGRRRLGPELRADGAHRLSDHGDRRLRPVAPGDARLRASEPDRQRGSRRSLADPLDRSRGVRLRAARHRSATRASASCARRATGTSIMSASKRVATFGRQYLLFRAEMFNALNHPNFGPPDRDIQSQNFGTINSTVNDARVVQMVLKYFF